MSAKKRPNVPGDLRAMFWRAYYKHDGWTSCRDFVRRKSAVDELRYQRTNRSTDVTEGAGAEGLARRAREELELLRCELFHFISGRIPRELPHAEIRQEWLRILRTDPERAKAMGLGWAL